MIAFDYKNDELHAEQVSLQQIATEFGTPAYVYSKAQLEHNWQQFDQAFSSIPHLVCYAVKANSNLAVLNLLAKLGSGFDIVSAGELARVIAAGGDPAKTVFSGVGKTHEEIRYALEHGIGCFNVESVAELERINAVAIEANMQAPISIRVNPDVDAQTHPYISTGLKENKFGIAIDKALAVYQRAASLAQLNVVGIDCHIGSQLTSIAPFVDALERVLVLVDELSQHDIKLQHVDIGGGLGVTYQDEIPPAVSDYAEALITKLQNRDVKVLIEPGRAISADAGVLLTKVEYLKQSEDRHFAIVDAAMNDLLRPALYQSWQRIDAVCIDSAVPAEQYDVVGPVCETGDFLGKARKLAIKEGDLLAVQTAGAYGFTMSSNYNSRPRAIEIMVDGDQAHVIRQRETVQSLFAGEAILPEENR